jgi:gliding motility-associated-like protein
MRKVFFFSFLIYGLFCFGQKQTQTIGFIENKGQIIDQKGKTNPDVKYLLNTPGLNVQLRKNGFSYDVYDTKKIPLTHKKQNKKKNELSILNSDLTPEQDYKLEYKYHRIDIDFVNSNTDVTLFAEEKSIDYDNYYNVVSNPEGILEVNKFQKVTYKNIYNNVDVVFFIPHDKTKPVEYNFVIRPGGMISDIQLKFKGVKNELINNKIKMSTRFGVMEETLPLSWTDEDNKVVSIGYKKISKNVYGFKSDDAIENKKIIIDPVPVRLWGTYFGGSSGEFPGSINIDSNNNVLISGNTGSSNNIATAGPNTSGYSNGGSFIAKFDPNGNLLWSSYYPFSTYNLKIAFNGNMCIYGNTLNANGFIPSPGCFQPIKDVYTSAYLIMLNSAGAKIWGTYYGGNQNENINSVTFDNIGNIYVVGATNSSDNFSTPGAHQIEKPSIGYYDTGFIAKFDNNGNRIWGTFYGGLAADGFFDCSISSDNYLYAVGTHNSQNGIVTPGAYQTTFNGTGGMIIKFDLDGNRIWGTYITNSTYLFRGQLNGDSMVLSGKAFSDSSGIGTSGSMFETFQPLPSGSILQSFENNFICKFNVVTQQYIWGTYFIEQLIGTDIDSFGNIYFSGYTGINNGITTPDGYMPTKTAYQKSFLVKIGSSGQKIWGTYYGGNFAEQFGKVKIDYNNDIYLYGVTNGSTTGIATLNSHQTVLGSNPDTYLVKFRDCLSVTQATSNNPCIGSNLDLTASGGTAYLWTGPNGFTSNQQNPTINNVNPTYSGLYSCSITGSAGCDNTISFNVIVGDTVKPVPNVASLSTINGNCNTVVSIPNATDNCVGIINGTTTDPLNYPLPGNYTIQWSYNDGNGNIQTQNQNIVITAVALPTITTPQKFCIQQNATLNDILITGTSIKWYDASTSGNLLANTTLLQDGITYYASQTLSGCESLRVPVTIQIQNTTSPSGTNQSFCATQNATLNDVIVSGTGIQWYSSITSSSQIPSNTILSDNTTYYATQTVNGCESVARLPITISLIFTLNATNYNTTVCDDGNDGSETVTLSDYDSNLISSTTGNTFTYYSSSNGAENLIAAEQLTVNHLINQAANIIYVRIDSSNGCHQVVELALALVNEPIVSIPNEIILCENKTVTVNAGIGFDSYSWSTGTSNINTIVLTQAGNYSVTVTQNHGSVICTKTKNFTVTLSNAPTIASIETIDWTDNQNSITINLSTLSIGDYEYSIDGENFQSSNVFNGLRNGEYIVTIRDKKGCGSVTKEVFLLNYPKFFTPNGDGYNDNWYIKFSEIEPNFDVKIFDRYGKILKVMNTNEFWDGTFNGKLMPADDYWFNVKREDGRIHKGHFTLKR